MNSSGRQVLVSVGKVDGTPVYELPLPETDGRRRYKVGTIEFKTLPLAIKNAM